MEALRRLDDSHGEVPEWADTPEKDQYRSGAADYVDQDLEHAVCEAAKRESPGSLEQRALFVDCETIHRGEGCHHHGRHGDARIVVAEQLQHNKSRAAWEQICRLAGCNASAGAASVSDNVTRYLDERLAVMQRLEVAAEKKLRECQTADEGLADGARAEEEFYRAGGSPMEWFGKCGTEEVFVHLLTHTHAHTQKYDMHEQI